MTKQYTMQLLNKKTNFFDINIYNEKDAKGMLEEYLECESQMEKSIKSKLIFSEIKKGNSFSINLKDGTICTFRIATDVDIKTAPLYRKAEEELVNSFLTEEDKEKLKFLKDFIKNTSSEKKDEVFNMFENNESSTD